jgi:uncharacterized protein
MSSHRLSLNDIKAKLPELLQEVPYLKLLVLFGSRARGDHNPSSDWDFALLFDEDLRQQYEPGGGWNRYRSWMILQNLLDLGDEELDWIDLKYVSEHLAHAIARDGIVIYEQTPGIFEQFHQIYLKSPEELKQISLTTKARIRQKLKALREAQV